MANTELWAYLNGKMVRENEAVIPLTDRGVQWGDAVYDSIRTYGGKPFQVPYRIDRFFRSLLYARVDPGITKETLRNATDKVIAANLKLIDANDDITINYYVSRGSMEATNGLMPAGTVAIFCRMISFSSFAKYYVCGAPAITPSTRRTPPECVSPKAKISNKMNHLQAEMEALTLGLAGFDGGGADMVAQLAARHPGVDGLGHLLLEGDAYVSIAVGLQPAGDFLDRGSATDAARN